MVCEGDAQGWIFLLEPGDGGVAAGIDGVIVEGLAFDVEIEPGELVAIDGGLVFGLEFRSVVVGEGEFGAGGAAEGDDDVAAAFAEGFDLVGVDVLVHGDAAEPGGVGVLVGDDEGECEVLLAGGFFELSDLEAVVGAEPDVGGEEAVGPIGEERDVEGKEEKKGEAFHSFSQKPRRLRRAVTMMIRIAMAMERAMAAARFGSARRA
jgi:hypothetical protein